MIDYRASGSATPEPSLHSWSPKKLRDQILMQIRTDFGGQDPRIVLARRAQHYVCADDGKQVAPFTPEQLTFIIEQMIDVASGSRERIKSKVHHLYERTLALSKFGESINGKFGFTHRLDNRVDSPPSIIPPSA